MEQLKSRPRKTAAEKVEDVLERISFDDLKQFVRDNVGQNAQLRKALLLDFTRPTAKESQMAYTNQVKAIVRKRVNSQGVMDWRGARKLGGEVAELIKTAQQRVAKKDYQSGIFIAAAVMEELTAVLESADDNHAYISSNISLAFDLLTDLASKKLPEESRLILFDFCISAFERGSFSDREWHTGILNIATTALQTEGEARQIMECLDKVHGSGFMRARAQEIKYRLITKTKGEKTAEKYLESNLSNNALRKVAIEKALESKHYQRALSLANDGILQDEAKWPGIFSQWRHYLLLIAQAQGDKASTVEHARILFMQNNKEEEHYYKILKDNIKASQWKNFSKELIEELSINLHHINFDLLAKIHVREASSEQLLKLLQENPSLYNLDHYGPYLTQDYGGELVKLYEPIIIESLKVSTLRAEYQTVCQYLRKMKKLGGHKTVERLIAKFKKEYSQRSALMQELSTVGVLPKKEHI